MFNCFVKFLVIGSLLLTMSACGGGGGGDEAVPAGNSMAYIVWSGSANGSVVVDATNDFLRFRADNGNMVFGTTTYDNIYVDDNAYVYLNGYEFGNISYIIGTNGSVITGLLCSNGTYADIYGYESSLNISCGGVYPVLASAFVKPLTAEVEENYNTQFLEASGASSVKNAFENIKNENTEQKINKLQLID